MCRTHNGSTKFAVIAAIVIAIIAAIFAITVSNGAAIEDGLGEIEVPTTSTPVEITETPVETEKVSTSTSTTRTAKAAMLANGMQEEAHIDVNATTGSNDIAEVTQADVDAMDDVETLELVEELADEDAPLAEIPELIESLPAIDTEKVISGVETKQETRIEAAKAAEKTETPDVGVKVEQVTKASEQVVTAPVTSVEEKQEVATLPVVVVEEKKTVEAPIVKVEAPKATNNDTVIDTVIEAAEEVVEQVTYTVTEPETSVIVVDF